MRLRRKVRNVTRISSTIIAGIVCASWSTTASKDNDLQGLHVNEAPKHSCAFRLHATSLRHCHQPSKATRSSQQQREGHAFHMATREGGAWQQHGRSRMKQRKDMFWIMIASTTTARHTEKLEERTITCNVAHERELWRRKGGRSEHLHASFNTCTAASPFQEIQTLWLFVPSSPSYRTRTEVIETKTFALPSLREHDCWRLNSPSADVYIVERVLFTEF